MKKPDYPTAIARVIDPSTVHIGGDFFRRERKCTMDVDEKGDMHCSICGQEMDFYDCGCGVGEFVYKHPRCFNCGARVERDA